MNTSAALLLSMAVALAGCKKSAPPADAAPIAIEAPVPAPEGMLAEGVVSTPDASWMKAQRGIGGAFGILPSTLGGMLCSVAGLDMKLAPEIDGASPAFFVLAGDPAMPRFAIAARLVDARRATRTMADARATAMATMVTPGGFLVVARSKGDLDDLGPYASRTLPARPMPLEAIAIDVGGAAIAGPVRAKLTEAWAAFAKQQLANDDALRAAHGGRAPDFGDPRAIVRALGGVIAKKLELCGDVDAAHVGVDVLEGSVRATVSIAPRAGAGPLRATIEAMHTGDAAPLLAFPSDAVIAALAHDDPSVRESDARDVADAIEAAVGTRASWRPADETKLRAALIDFARGRGDWTAASYLSGKGRQGVLVRAASADVSAASRSVRSMLELTRAPAFAGPLHALLGVKSVGFSTATVAGFDHAEVATVVSDKPGARLAVAWGASAGELRVAVASDPLPLLATATDTLGADAKVRALLTPLGSDASLVVVAQPSHADAAPSSPVVFAWGRRSGKLWGELDVSDPVLRDVARF